jgi:hypothetical protein
MLAWSVTTTPKYQTAVLKLLKEKRDHLSPKATTIYTTFIIENDAPLP